MLLNDIGKSPDATFRKINQHLESNYGFKISEDVSDKDLVSIMEQIEEEITDLKVKGDDAKTSPEISKRLLVLEGIQSLREFAILQFQSPDLEHVLQGLSDYVCDHFRISGTSQSDYEEAVNDAMKHYRSSRYRFPDDLVEQRVRQMSMSKIHGQPAAGELGVKIEEPVFPTMMESEDEEMKQEDLGEDLVNELSRNTLQSYSTKADPWARDTSRADQKIAQKKQDSRDANREANRKTVVGIPMNQDDLEEDTWGSVGKRASARGGYSPDSLNKTQQDVLGKLGFSSDPEIEEPIKMVRDKHGRMVPDPFAAQAAARRKGIVMKENLVKNLRRLLETEVSQAEVMMAAKGFAQELQEMIEKIGRLQNEDLPPVTDQMRETYGMESASAFQTQIYGALQSVMDSLYTAKGQVDDAVSSMASTGQFNATVDMEKDPAMDMGGVEDPALAMDAEADLDNIEADLDTDDFGAAGEEEPLGRAMKESALQCKVMEMRRLVEKARALRGISEEQETDDEEIDEAVRAAYYDAAGETRPTRNTDDRNYLASQVKKTRAHNRASGNTGNTRGAASAKGQAPGSGATSAYHSKYSK